MDIRHLPFLKKSGGKKENWLNWDSTLLWQDHLPALGSGVTMGILGTFLSRGHRAKRLFSQCVKSRDAGLF
jgi:hypothetical protein